MAGDQGIEPRLAAPKTAVLPLDESPLAEGEGIEPPNPLRSTVFETASSTNRTPSVLFTRCQKDMAVRAGIEPTFPGSEPGVLPLDHRPMLVAPPGIEPGVAVCNTAALPLGHGAMLAESTGFEPTSPLRLLD